MTKLHISPDLSLPLESVTQTFAILAKRGMGKTYTAAVMVEEMLKAGQQVVVVDPVGVWWGLRSSASGEKSGFPIVIFGGDHADLPIESESAEDIVHSILDQKFSAILDLSLLRKGEQVRFMTAFAEALYRLCRTPLHLAIDEADAFAPQRPMPGEQRLLGAIEDIVRRGRARGLGVTFITQRAAVINKNVLTQIEVLVILRTIAPQDREAIDAWIEIHGTREQKEQLTASIASLPIGTAWFWSPAWLDIFKKVRIRTRETFDSSSTPIVNGVSISPKAMAEINLAALGEKLKEAKERSRENDPEFLKEEIRRLKGEIEEFQSDESQGRDYDELLHLSMALVVNQNEVADQRKKIQDLWEKFHAELRENNPPITDGAISPANGDETIPVTNRPLDPIAKTPTAGLLRILAALADRPKGLTGKQLGVRAGLSSSSGTFNTYLAKLRAFGFVEGDRGSLQITRAGLKAVPERARNTRKGRELQQYWLGDLGGSGAGRMLEALIKIYPRGLSKPELAGTAQLSPTSGTFNTYLSKLRSLELIEGRDVIKASEELFS